MTRTPQLPAFDGTQLCAQIGDVELFVPTQGVNARTAKKVCLAGCNFLDACLEYALAVDVTGIWGGTSHHERDQIRTARNIVPAPASGLPISVRDEAYDWDTARRVLVAYSQGDRSPYVVEGRRWYNRMIQRQTRTEGGDAA